MKREEAHTMAGPLKINFDKFIKIGLVRALQTEEGNVGCFATAYYGVCGQAGCFWREDCLAEALENGSHELRQ